MNVIFTVQSFLRGVGVRVEEADLPDTWGELSADGDVVRIHRHLDDQTKTIMLLHEASHLFLKHNQRPEHVDPIDQLIEEVEAWQHAEQMICQMHVPVNRDEFKRIRNLCVKTFCRM